MGGKLISGIQVEPNTYMIELYLGKTFESRSSRLGTGTREGRGPHTTGLGAGLWKRVGSCLQISFITAAC
jgi:hypothetical protein